MYDSELKAVNIFTYLGGSDLSTNARIDAEVASRLSKASSVFGRLMDKVWDVSGIRTQKQNLMCIMLSYYQPCCMELSPGQCTKHMPTNSTGFIFLA